MASTTAAADASITATEITPIPPNQDDSLPATHPESQPQSVTADSPPSPAPSLRPSITWKSIRSTISVSEKTSAQLGWAIAFLSFLFTVVALSPTFRSQTLSEKSLKLAEWTALKDFIEECREELQAGVESQACVKAMNAKIPPPPYIRAGILDKLRRSLVTEHYHQVNGTSRGTQVQYERVDPSRALLLSIAFFSALLIAYAFLRLGFEHMRRIREQHIGEKDHQEASDFPEAPSQDEVTTSSITVRHPPPDAELFLRRRAVRTHPIYRHTTLDEAIHAGDMDEIRIRLRNGEDVNDHWPYLIYRLAISPKTPERAKRIEVARLCLDYGADVNALKGWNGQSALLIAIHFGNVDVAKLLIANGAMVCYSPPDSNLTALHRCVRLAATGSALDALEIMNMLFKYGANANQVDRLNETPLHKLLIDAWFARQDENCFRKLWPIALCLIKHGACLPSTMEEKHIVRNPLWELVQSEIRDKSNRPTGDQALEKRGYSYAANRSYAAESLTPQGKRAEWMDVNRTMSSTFSYPLRSPADGAFQGPSMLT